MNAPPAPGQQPTPQQIAAMQQQMALEAQKRGMTPQQFQQLQRQQLEADAKKAGMTLEQYINQVKQQAFQNHQRQQQLAQQQAATAQQQGGQVQGQQQQSQQVPINPGAPDPKALAVAKWLRGQDLKSRTCVLNGQRKDMIKVKRALRALQSAAYQKASAKKNSPLPPVTSEASASEVFKLLPLSLLALRVTKVDPHEGHNHGPPTKPQKRIKGLWTVRIEQQQDIRPELHYVWLYEGPQLKQKLYAAGALAAIMAIVMFPLWPIKLRIGVWYLSMGMLGLIALFFAMAIFRLILFCVTVFAVPPGLWLYPNLFEDVGFFDSFRPVWGWQEEKKKKKKSKKSGSGADDSKPQTSDGNTPSAPLSVTKTSGASNGSAARLRDLAPRIEEVQED
ncbi:Translocation protein S62 [Hypocenomyce scalaris]|nr:Translocation protein S62 [Hypocenomyce scalaris]